MSNVSSSTPVSTVRGQLLHIFDIESDAQYGDKLKFVIGTDFDAEFPNKIVLEAKRSDIIEQILNTPLLQMVDVSYKVRGWFGDSKKNPGTKSAFNNVVCTRFENPLAMPIADGPTPF